MSNSGGHNRFTYAICGLIHLHWVDLGFDCINAGVRQRRGAWNIGINRKLRRPTAFISRRAIRCEKLVIWWPLLAKFMSWKHSVVGTSLLNCLKAHIRICWLRYCFIYNTSFTAVWEIDILSVVEAFAGLFTNVRIFKSILEICALICRVGGLLLWGAELSEMWGIHKSFFRSYSLSLSPCC